MTITIYDYKGKGVDCLIRPLSDVSLITMLVLSGDETITVYYKDGEREDFDSSSDRMTDYIDGTYLVYSEETNLFDNKEWLSSNDSYDRRDIALSRWE